jgi:site-specific DNA recombinase
MRAGTLRCVLYIRVSSRKQLDGISLEDQERQGRAYAERAGWSVTFVYVEPGRSAFTEDLTKRVAFNQMLADARAGLFDVVLVYKLNRFARNVPTQYQAAADLERYGVQIASATEPIERKTASGRATFGMLAVMAQLQSDQLSEKMRHTRLAEARQGRHVGPIPVGYNRENGLLTPSEDAPAVRMAARLRASGQYTHTDIARALNDEGWRVPSRFGGRRRYSEYQVEEMLKNPIYIGLVRCKGQVFPGKHEPLIDPEIWERVRAVEAERSNRRVSAASTVIKTPAASLVDLAYCAACGARMWFQSANPSRSRAYYICSDHATGGECPARGCRADIVDQALLDFVRRLAVPEEWHDTILRRAAVITTSFAPTQPVDREAVEASLRSLRLDFADERLDEVTYQREKARLLSQLEQPIEIRAVPNVGGYAPMLWDLSALVEVATPLERNAVYRGIINRVWVEPHRITALTPTRSYEGMLVAASELFHRGGPGGVRTHDTRLKRPLLYH